MDSSKNGLVRRRKTSEERQRLLARFHESQMTQREFAARHGIGLSTLGKWLRVESTAPLLRVVQGQSKGETGRAGRLKFLPFVQSKPRLHFHSLPDKPFPGAGTVRSSGIAALALIWKTPSKL